MQFAEPILFGRLVDSLSRGDGVFRPVALWAALGIFEIFASLYLNREVREKEDATTTGGFSAICG